MGARPLVSVLIPSRNERFLNHTIRDVLAHASGHVEVIAVLDGYWPEPVDDPAVRYIHRGRARGMRAAINAAAELATGRYLLKTDGHCMFADGFDEVLAGDCDDDWVVVPRRKRLDAEQWCVQDVDKPDIDYMFLSYPDDPNDWGGDIAMHGKLWEERNRDDTLKKVLVDDLMSFQGSAWFMPRDYFFRLDLMDDVNYGTFLNEPQEIGLKAWLSGGRLVVNKKTWYAHLHKGKKYGRGYTMSQRDIDVGARYTYKWFAEPMGEAWPGQTLPLAWLIERFWPVPSWPDDRDLWGANR